MAEVLVRLDGRGLGNIITVQPSGWEWGRKEGPPKFTILEFDDVEPSSLYRYLERGSGIPTNNESSGVIYRKRRWQIDISAISGLLRHKMLGVDTNRTGRIIIGSGINKTEDITWNDFRQYVFDKLNRQTEEDNNTTLETRTDARQRR